MCGRPGLAHIVDEVAAIGSDRAVVVHHPYYTPLIDWTRQVLAPGALARYRALTNQLPVKPRPADHLRVDFIAQRGRYADVTSVLNGAEHLRTGSSTLSSLTTSTRPTRHCLRSRRPRWTPPPYWPHPSTWTRRATTE